MIVFTSPFTIRNLNLSLKSYLVIYSRKNNNNSILIIISDPSNPKTVILNKLNLVVADMDDKVLELTGDLGALKEKPFTIKVILLLIL